MERMFCGTAGFEGSGPDMAPFAQHSILDAMRRDWRHAYVAVANLASGASMNITECFAENGG